MNTIRSYTARLVAISGILFVPVYKSRGVTVDLSITTSGSIAADVGGTAWFERAANQPTGTGIFNPFLRLQHNSSRQHSSLGDPNLEQAYNTDGRLGNNGGQAPLEALSDPNFTRSLRLGDLLSVNRNGIDYFVFELDANEPDSEVARLLSIDNIRIYTAPASDGGDSITTDIDTLGQLRFALNNPNIVDPGPPAPANDWVGIDASHNFSDGSGQSDMYAYIPVSAFSGALLTDYVYFYNLNGVNYKAEDGTESEGGFEEWRALVGPPTNVPDGGSTLIMLGSALSVGGLIARLKRGKRDSRSLKL